MSRRIAEDYWASDAPISMPEPPQSDRPVMVLFGGFAFTTAGLTHNITHSERDEIATPYFAPGPTPKRGGS